MILLHCTGWFGYGDELSCIAAFLFTWRTGESQGHVLHCVHCGYLLVNKGFACHVSPGNLKDKPLKMRKVGGAAFAVNDVPGKGIQVMTS